ncbi:hypothetical protein GWI33_014509 [Rhynchophorus ferrugineus]|uniref:Uncharacterized protein n=1 Tax=Rhynchophorus ferrugineus TaxID=354439 RepID=A0A834I4X3_RHYFE|nr:hypothetical protein GWI33_014509 [Rhynchophorus ferrugineus]
MPGISLGVRETPITWNERQLFQPNIDHLMINGNKKVQEAFFHPPSQSDPSSSIASPENNPENRPCDFKMKINTHPPTYPIDRGKIDPASENWQRNYPPSPPKT